jgi:hypothetical protein
MNKPGLLRLSISLLIAGLAAHGTPALAQGPHHLHRVATLSGDAGKFVSPNTVAPPLAINGLQATLTQITATTGQNADGSDLWPCFGFGPANTNVDCPTVGNPTVALPIGGAILGFPSYVWLLQNPTPGQRGNWNGNGCDALVNGTSGPFGSAYKPCTQIATWYEDNTNDSTDDLLQQIVVTQGSRIIYDSGTVDYGPAGPSVHYPVDVILNTDANFGYWPGASNGPNNGNCSPNIRYPLTSAAFPSNWYVVQSGATCQEPLPGAATFHTATTLATPQYSEMSGSACTLQGVASPCYAVKWTRNYEIKQDFQVFFE